MNEFGLPSEGHERPPDNTAQTINNVSDVQPKVGSSLSDEFPKKHQDSEHNSDDDLTEEPKPLVLRGHHLQAARSILASDKSPEEQAETNVRHTKASRFVPGFPSGYAEDVLGSTTEEEETFKAKVSDIFEQIQTLPDDRRVEVVDGGQKDDICRVCTIGDHCNFHEVAQTDNGYTEVFSRKIDKLGLADTATTTEDEEGRRTINVSGSTFKNVLASMGGTELFVRSYARAEILKAQKMLRPNNRSEE